MRRLISITVIAVCMVLSGCYYSKLTVVGSGVLESRELGYSDFQGIELYLPATVSIVPATDYGVTMKADDNILDLITVYPADGGDSLRFALDPRCSYRQVSIEIEIRTPSFTELGTGTVSGTYIGDASGPRVTIQSGFTSLTDVVFDVRYSELTIGELVAQSLDIISNLSSVSIGALTLDDLDVSLYGDEFTIGECTASKLGMVAHRADIDANITCDEAIFDMTACSDSAISGTATVLDLTANAVELDLTKLVVSEADVDIAESSDVELTVTDILSGFVELESSITYPDSPGLDISGLVIEEDPTSTPLPSSTIGG